MYVCLCRSVTDHHIRREVEDGARSMQDLNKRLGVASQCGRCGRCAKSVLDQSVRELREMESADLVLSPA